MTLDFSKIKESLEQAEQEASQITEGKYGKHNIAARKHLQVVQNESLRLKKEITKLVSPKK